MRRPLVVIESPFQGLDVATEYLKSCMLDSIGHGEAPFASHQLYTLVLDDTVPHERELGMELGFAWGAKASRCAVYIDHGISEGMKEGIRRAYGVLTIDVRSIWREVTLAEKNEVLEIAKSSGSGR